ncbi:hypothetical protein ACRS5S_17000 [Nocardia asiatica]|uniref:hypothetical protein n=1 Tax=Nocardia asiatica TaxID=209252 RepID=UPI003EE30FCE
MAELDGKTAVIVGAATLAQATHERFDKVFSINSRGTIFSVQKALPWFSPPTTTAT